MDHRVLDLDTALAIASAVLSVRRHRGHRPLTVAVLDPGGHVVVLQREDGSGILRPQIAVGKALGALGMGFGTRELARLAQENPQFVAALSALSPGGLVPAPGGVLVRLAAGATEVLGAVGVSGDTSDRDEECALHAIASVGLTADPG